MLVAAGVLLGCAIVRDPLDLGLGAETARLAASVRVRQAERGDERGTSRTAFGRG